LLQFSVNAIDVAGIEQMLNAMRWKISQHAPDRIRALRRADAPMIAAHSFVAGKTDQCSAVFGCVVEWLDDLMQATRVACAVGIAPAGPNGWIYHAALLC
jgi:hypothetical protein